MRLPWWHTRQQPESPIVQGSAPSARETKRLVVTRRDQDGDPVEETWVDESAYDGYDDTRWRESWR